jgi:hypothetical protein
MEFASFPKNLAYNVKTLSGFSKTTVKPSPDKTGTIQMGDTVKALLRQLLGKFISPVYPVQSLKPSLFLYMAL